MRELATPELADDANMAFSRTIDVVNCTITPVGKF
jgi:hypothetical protein